MSHPEIIRRRLPTAGLRVPGLLRFFGVRVRSNRKRLGQRGGPSLWLSQDVDRTAIQAEALRNYRRLARENHPDAGGDASRFAEVAAAWRKLVRLMRKAEGMP